MGTDLYAYFFNLLILLWPVWLLAVAMGVEVVRFLRSRCR